MTRRLGLLDDLVPERRGFGEEFFQPVFLVTIDLGNTLVGSAPEN
jgi:hypothetical protein